MTSALSEVEDIYFDGIFYTVPSQFYQQWTIFSRFGRHTLPVIHCILTDKYEEIYTAVLAEFMNLFRNKHLLMGFLIGKRVLDTL